MQVNMYLCRNKRTKFLFMSARKNLSKFEFQPVIKPYFQNFIELYVWTDVGKKETFKLGSSFTRQQIYVNVFVIKIDL